MIVLAATDTLVAGADTASKITCTIFGMTLLAGVETYSILDQRQLANTPSTIYTVAASTTCFIKSIAIVNTDLLASHSFQFFRGGTAAGNAITPLILIPPGSSAYYEDGESWQIVNKTGQLLDSGASGLEPVESYVLWGDLANTIERPHFTDTNTALAKNTLYLQAIWLQAGMVIQGFGFMSAATAGATLTHQIFGLYSKDLALLLTTTDMTSGSWAANLQKNRSIENGVTPYTVPTTGLYYLAIMVDGTTIPTLRGQTAKTGGELNATAPILSGWSTAGLTTTLPATADAITAKTTSIWGCVR